MGTTDRTHHVEQSGFAPGTAIHWRPAIGPLATCGEHTSHHPVKYANMSTASSQMEPNGSKPIFSSFDIWALWATQSFFRYWHQDVFLAAELTDAFSHFHICHHCWCMIGYGHCLINDMEIFGCCVAVRGNFSILWILCSYLGSPKVGQMRPTHVVPSLCTLM